MNKIRYWDNRSASWLSRYFYIPFLALWLGIFFLFFLNGLQLIHLHFDMPKNQITHQLLFNISLNTAILGLLTFLNSFWMFYVFNHVIKIRGLLKNIDYNLSRRNDKSHKDQNPNA